MAIILLSRRKAFVAVFLTSIAIAFSIYSWFDRENFFHEMKKETALQIGVEFILDKRGATDVDAVQFMKMNPTCCIVSQYYGGQSPSKDNRTLIDVVDNKLFSLTGLETYVVFVSFPKENRTSLAEVSGRGDIREFIIVPPFPSNMDNLNGPY
jgi:hypothetical protein